MKGTFRQSMNWLHTWSGLVVGWVLFFMFVTGTAGYFVSEIDHWMQPEIPYISDSGQHQKLVELAQQRLVEVAPLVESWRIYLPNDRDRTLKIRWKESSETYRETLHPETGKVIETRETGGGDQLYEMHYRLHYMPTIVAYALTSLCAMFMLVALISGVVVHKKIFKDFFTFRPGKNQRSWLDMHNMMSVLPLPFHFMITYSGLLFLMFTSMPAVYMTSYGSDLANRQRFAGEIRSAPSQIVASHQLETLGSLSSLLTNAEQRWGRGNVERISVEYPGDKNARVTVDKRADGSVSEEKRLVYNGVDNTLIKEIDDKDASASNSFYYLMLRLHAAEYAGTVLRWLYFLSGFMGAGMIATGSVLWANKRRTKAQKNGKVSKGLVLVEHLNVGTVTGLPVAIATYFIANRLLPVAMEGRAAWEVNILFYTWAGMFLYPLVIRKFTRVLNSLWVQQLTLAALLYMALPIINALTTDRHLGTSLVDGDWMMAGFDICMLIIGVCFAGAALKLRSKERSKDQSNERSHSDKTRSSLISSAAGNQAAAQISAEEVTTQ